MGSMSEEALRKNELTGYHRIVEGVLLILLFLGCARTSASVSSIGSKRRRAPGAELAAIPKIDIVFISHNHYDHMDIDSLREIEKRDHPIFILPIGNKQHLAGIGAARIVELNWWDSFKAGKAKISLVPMQHSSSRTLMDRNESFWGGFVLNAPGVKVLFAGDTGYNSHFNRIREKFGPMDISILPIGAYEPRWFMKPLHIQPWADPSLSHTMKVENLCRLHKASYKKKTL